MAHTMQSRTVDRVKNFSDNKCRYAGEDTGHYEVWFITLNDRATGCGFWFRYTIDVLQNSTRPEPGLWGAFFDADDRSKNFGIKKYFPAEAWLQTDEAAGRVIGVD